MLRLAVPSDLGHKIEEEEGQKRSQGVQRRSVYVVVERKALFICVTDNHISWHNCAWAGSIRPIRPVIGHPQKIARYFYNKGLVKNTGETVKVKKTVSKPANKSAIDVFRVEEEAKITVYRTRGIGGGA
ncbi:hypothetical protein C8J57DRAFT_1483680 [Mycena rebaudengoi]|nr:hypothetical protein C8J57DRAFT_1483680 [Mycena rebaudengoi]